MWKWEEVISPTTHTHTHLPQRRGAKENRGFSNRRRRTHGDAEHQHVGVCVYACVHLLCMRSVRVFAWVNLTGTLFMRASPSLTSATVNNVDETMSMALRCLHSARSGRTTGGRNSLGRHGPLCSIRNFGAKHVESDVRGKYFKLCMQHTNQAFHFSHLSRGWVYINDETPWNMVSLSDCWCLI